MALQKKQEAPIIAGFFSFSVMVSLDWQLDDKLCGIRNAVVFLYKQRGYLVIQFPQDIYISATVFKHPHFRKA